MDQWTIAFQHQTLLIDATGDARRASSAGIETTDADWDQCFRLLTSGNDVYVRCTAGMRRAVDYCMQHFCFVRAAGGVVAAPDGRRLLIFRNGRWDLPKGKVESGETLRQAALREVTEETGMHDLSLGPLLRKTYHIYNLYGGWHLKQTSWFAMSVPEAYDATPQTEEGIEKGEWVSREELCRRLTDSYATLRMVSQVLQEKDL